jgi:hypothetical protein
MQDYVKKFPICVKTSLRPFVCNVWGDLSHFLAVLQILINLEKKLNSQFFSKFFKMAKKGQK